MNDYDDELPSAPPTLLRSDAVTIESKCTSCNKLATKLTNGKCDECLSVANDGRRSMKRRSMKKRSMKRRSMKKRSMKRYNKMK